MKTIYFIRHCRATGQEPESALTIDGELQAEALAEFLMDKQIDRIISSPYSRAIQSIQPFANLSAIPLNLDARLSERILSTDNCPDWMEKLNASFEDMDLKFPGGESSREATQRVREVVSALLDSGANNAVLVSHGNLLALIIRSFDKDFGFKEWRAMTNPDVFELKHGTDGEFSIARIWK